jgi:putative transcriptional regulator
MLEQTKVINIKLQSILDARGMSQRELGRLTGIRYTTIQEMCKNQSKHIPLNNLAKICEALNVDIPDILELVEIKSDSK